MSDERVDLTKAPQHRGDQEASKGAIPRRQSANLWVVFDRVVERALAAKHRADQVGSNAARGRWYGLDGC